MPALQEEASSIPFYGYNFSVKCTKDLEINTKLLFLFFLSLEGKSEVSSTGEH